MDDKQLGDSLVKLDTAGAAQAADAGEQTRRILERDRRWVRGWTIVTIVLWVPAVLLILGVLVYLGLLFPLQAKLEKMRDQQTATPGGVDEERVADKGLDSAVEEHGGGHVLHHGHEPNLAQLERDTEIGFKMMSALTGLAVLALSMALLCSFVVTLVTRRATLREINAHLALISDQLKRLEATAR